MRNLIISIAALFGIATLEACSNFLDETPDKSGSAYIYHMDQLYGMMGSTDLYLSSDATDAVPGYYWAEQTVLTDAIEYSPEFYALGMKSGNAEIYDIYCYGTDQLERQSTMDLTWTPSWERIYRFNTVLENLDNVIQTTQAVRDQVEGEARFGRAYYHFLLLVQYSLWNEDAPGIGYRENTEAGEIPERQTVGYTLSRIYEDLQLAEKALTRAGRTEFDSEHNFRPTVPTVQAFRARVDLYRGNYESALQNATDALKAHNTLETFKDDPAYNLYSGSDIYLLNEDFTVADTIHTYILLDLFVLGEDQIATFDELFLPHIMSEYNWDDTPISESFYNLWDKQNDVRWAFFYGNCFPLLSPGVTETITTPDGTIIPNSISYETRQWLKEWYGYNYARFYCGASESSILGMTTAEMYLIKAECEARAGNTSAAAEDLKTLRRTRFYDMAAAEDITGNIQDVLDERYREMGAIWRFYDIKRLNGAENAGITIRREILTDPTDLNTRTWLEIAPDDPRWAIPINPQEAERSGWQQNEGWE